MLPGRPTLRGSCTTELDYTEQISWLLFLKYLDSLEQDKAYEAKLEGKGCYERTNAN